MCFFKAPDVDVSLSFLFSFFLFLCEVYLLGVSVCWALAPGVFAVIDKAAFTLLRKHKNVSTKLARVLARKAPRKLQGGILFLIPLL